jgi:arsenate reductase (thioredoxin)
MRVNVLFISSGNSVRSQMAEAFLRELAGGMFEPSSAGSEAKPIDPMTVAVMAERGIDVGAQRSKTLHEYIGLAHFDYIVTVCDRYERACPAFPGKGTREYWPFADPTMVEGGDEVRLARFREVRDQIEARVRLWLEKRPQTAAFRLRPRARPRGSVAR